MTDLAEFALHQALGEVQTVLDQTHGAPGKPSACQHLGGGHGKAGGA